MRLREICVICATILTLGASNAMAEPASGIKIAVLLPEHGSAFTGAAAVMAEGVRAQHLLAKDGAKIVTLPAKRGQRAASRLQDAALSGASVAIGPLEKNAVEELLHEPFLPIPVVALNVGDGQSPTPPLMMNFSLSLEEEARQIARVAVRALPAATQNGDRPSVRIFETEGYSRIADAYAEVLDEAQVPYGRELLTKEGLDKTRLLYEMPKADESEKPELVPVPDQYEDPYGYQRANLKNRAIMSEFNARLAYREPPYFGALLAMDDMMAALVKPRLPRLAKVWGTSVVNPSGSSAGGQVSVLTYDLQGLAFVDVPIVGISSETQFMEKFGTEAPATALDRRLFALGADAYRLAIEWARLSKDIEFNGASGRVAFHQDASPVVEREAAYFVVGSKGVRQTAAEELEKPVEIPKFEEQGEKAQQ